MAPRNDHQTKAGKPASLDLQSANPTSDPSGFYTHDWV